MFATFSCFVRPLRTASSALFLPTSSLSSIRKALTNSPSASPFIRHSLPLSLNLSRSSTTFARSVVLTSSSPGRIPRFTALFTPLRQLHTSRPRNMALKEAWQSWTKTPAAEPAKYSSQWWWVWTIRFIVFGITGSSSVKFVTPLLDTFFGIKGSWLEGPWSFRLASFVFVTPIYTVILLMVGTIFGQHYYFRHVALKLWSRLLPGIVKRPGPLPAAAAKAK
eukprot:m.21784 g.21784  ORF g.21784 m.21784 type:complete len:222 (-) comp9182_c0_seq1:200-865(-)